VKGTAKVELRPDLPVIGLRRMTEYKRAGLLFEDVERLAEIARRRPFRQCSPGWRIRATRQAQADRDDPPADPPALERHPDGVSAQLRHADRRQPGVGADVGSTRRCRRWRPPAPAA
jgi:hypothetical protein